MASFTGLEGLRVLFDLYISSYRSPKSGLSQCLFLKSSIPNTFLHKRSIQNTIPKPIDTPNTSSCLYSPRATCETPPEISSPCRWPLSCRSPRWPAACKTLFRATAPHVCHSMPWVHSSYKVPIDFQGNCTNPNNPPPRGIGLLNLCGTLDCRHLDPDRLCVTMQDFEQHIPCGVINNPRAECPIPRKNHTQRERPRYNTSPASNSLASISTPTPTVGGSGNSGPKLVATEPRPPSPDITYIGFCCDASCALENCTRLVMLHNGGLFGDGAPRRFWLPYNLIDNASCSRA
ncbi:hypothetical protein B0H66DRAFT_394498 [Apodospora peruviana]|uniref:Uncharacterized protein n=1 Tax=Apodospora peruviana TaxID=516989 RepID=A0AAE0LY82_9PEZI|nr:hypothetical protein B0H66DRAFT_394498 [Apodospora peruviana]